MDVSPLYYAHSGLRYLVLFAGVAALVVLAAGLLRHAPYGRGARAAGTAFVVALHLQVLLGVGLILGGIWYPALAGHLVLMLGAAVAAPLGTVRAKRAADPRGAYVRALAGVGVALLLVLGGIMAIGRGVLESRTPTLSAANASAPLSG